MLNKENMSKYLSNTGKQTSIHKEPVATMILPVKTILTLAS